MIYLYAYTARTRNDTLIVKTRRNETRKEAAAEWDRAACQRGRLYIQNSVANHSLHAIFSPTVCCINIYNFKQQQQQIRIRVFIYFILFT